MEVVIAYIHNILKCSTRLQWNMMGYSWSHNNMNFNISFSLILTISHSNPSPLSRYPYLFLFPTNITTFRVMIVLGRCSLKMFPLYSFGQYYNSFQQLPVFVSHQYIWSTQNNATRSNFFKIGLWPQYKNLIAPSLV